MGASGASIECMERHSTLTATGRAHDRSELCALRVDLARELRATAAHADAMKALAVRSDAKTVAPTTATGVPPDSV